MLPSQQISTFIIVIFTAVEVLFLAFDLNLVPNLKLEIHICFQSHFNLI